MLSEHRKNNAFFRQLLFIAVLILIGIIVFEQLHFFLGSFLGATTIYVVLRGIMFKLTDEYEWKPWVASLLLVFGIALLLMGVSYLIFRLIASEIPSINTSQIVVGMNELLDDVNKTIGFKVLPEDIIQRSEGFIAKLVSSVFNATYSFAANIFLMLVILYFMLTGGRRMEKYMQDYSPFTGKSQELLKREVKNMIFSNAVGIPVIMLAQAVVASLIYWLLGINNVFFWAFLTGLCGLIPLVGTGMVWIPLGIYLVATGHFWQGIILALYALLVISNTDNLIRIGLMKRGANTHPLIVIFGVILGIPLFGFWGIIFGPLLISGFMLLLRIYYVEYELISPEDN